MNKSKSKSNFEKLHNSIDGIPPDKLKLIASIGLFLMVSLLFYQQLMWFSGEKIAVQIPGVMSIVPAYKVQHFFDENFDKSKLLKVDIKACSTIQPVCVPCWDCQVDLYYDYGNGKQLYEKNVSIDTNGAMFIEIRTIPTWLYVSLNGTYYGDLRIPKASLMEYVIEKSTDSTNKLTFFVTWVWLITAGIAIYTVLKRTIKWCLNKIKQHKEKKKKPEYIG